MPGGWPKAHPALLAGSGRANLDNMPGMPNISRILRSLATSKSSCFV